MKHTYLSDRCDVYIEIAPVDNYLKKASSEIGFDPYYKQGWGSSLISDN